MKCSWFTPLFLFAMAGALPAQEQIITPEMRVDYDTLHQWLHGGDPRLIAWAADFARRGHDAQLLAEMPALLEHWTMPPLYGGDEAQQAERRAVQAVLDALIQENAKLPIPAIDTVAPAFPAQAAILIGRLPLSESRVTLGDWTYGETGSWRGRLLARIASMMLAKDPGNSLSYGEHGMLGFVASIISASEEDLYIAVSPSMVSHGNIGSGVCGDYVGHKLTPGWPQVYTYDLVEDDAQVSAPVVVDLDGDRIISRRFEENNPWGSCNGVRGLDRSTRHKIIAYWLGVSEKEMSWQPVENVTIVWTDKAAYQLQLGEIVEAQRKKLRATVEALRQRGLLRESETADLSPRLYVTVQCEIIPCPLE